MKSSNPEIPLLKETLYLKKPSALWYWGLGFSLFLLATGALFTINTVGLGIGEWGVNKSAGWGFAIINFVWWIGIGHAGTFISAILLLFRQNWRSGISRLAETMTIIAIICAAFFPLIHLGRVHYTFYIFPYTNTRNLWVNFNSPLIWDVFAILTYFLVSLMFWLSGLIPDLAFLKNHIQNKILKKVYSKFSFNWKGSNTEWQRHKNLTLLLAGIATPLVISVHSVVSMDFAVSIVPGWHSTIFPPYFVAGAILSGFAMVQLIALPARKMMRLDRIITLKHIDNMNKIILLTGSIVLVSYLTEIFYAYNSQFHYEWREIVHRFTGKYAFAFYLMLLGNALLPQLLWFRKIRLNLTVTFLLSLIIVISMWFERYIIVVSSLSGGFIESAFIDYKPTITDIGLLAGSVGFFFTVLLLFIRYFPVVPVTELIKEVRDE